MLLEIEKDFALTDHDRIIIEQNCDLQTEKTTQDVYMDTADFQLISRNIWLRKRNGKIELKYPQGGSIHEKHVFEEYYDDDAWEKLQTLDVNIPDITDQFIVTTHRKTYTGTVENIPFTVCVDIFEAGSLYEVEITHARTKEEGLHMIDTIVETLHLQAKFTRGKVLVTIEQEKPELFAFLKERGVV